MMTLGKAVNSAINAVAPGFQVRRFAAREQVRMMELAAKIRQENAGQLSGRFYAAANPGLDRSMARQINSTEDYRQAYERIVMLRYSQQMEEDIPYVESILGDYETYVVGSLRYRPNTGNPEADKVIQEHLEWRFSECDYAREMDLTDFAKLAIRAKKRDGEMGFAFIDLGEDLRLSGIGADRIGNPLIGTAVGNNNFNGIIINEDSGQVISFDIWRRIPKVNAYVFDRNIPANAFIHFRDKFRINQYHGVTAFRTAITRSVDVEKIVQFAIQNIKFRSSQIPAIQNELGRPKAPGSGYQAQAPNTNGVPQPYELQVDGVTQTFLKLGEGFVEFPHDFPNANFIDIKDDLKGDIALGLHLPGEFCFRSKAGGVLQRFYIEKAQRTFDEEKRLMKKGFLNPYKNRVLRKDVDSGILNLDRFPGLAGDMMLYSGDWHMGRSVTTDYGHDTISDIALIDAGLMSPDEHWADNARDGNEIRRAKKKRAVEAFEDAEDIAKQVGRPLSEVLPYILKIFPNPVLVERAQDLDPSLAGQGNDQVPPGGLPIPAGAPSAIPGATAPKPAAPAAPAPKPGFMKRLFAGKKS